MNVPLIGPAVNRVDGRLKVTGGATYAAEFAIPNVAHGYLVLSTIARGRIEKIDASSAEASAGVLAVFTHLNLPPLAGAASHDEENPATKRLNLLQDDKIHFNGQPIALVVADTFEQAAAASTLIRTTYVEEEPTLDLEADAENFFEPEGGPHDYIRGDPSTGLSTAEARVEEIYITPMENHNPMEPHAIIAVWEEPDQLTIYDTTQGVHPARQRLAALLDLPVTNVRVITHFLGGGFGCKGPMWSHVPLAAVAARRLRRPVKVVLTRQQMYNNTGFRSRTVQKLAFAAKKSGALTAQRHETFAQTSDFDEYVETAGFPTRMLYSCPNVAVTHRVAKLNIGTPSYMRAPGEASGSFALESAMDEMAYRLKIDPLEFRLRNYAEKDEHRNKPWSSKALRECYTRGAEKFGWNRRKPAPRSMRAGNLLVGYGMASATYGTYRSDASALARINADGTALVQAGTQDLGTGTYTVMTQIAADALGLPIDKVRFELGDTNFPENPISGGSQATASTGSAVQAAVLDVIKKLAKIAVEDAASPLNGEKVGDVIADRGRLVLSGDTARGEEFSVILRRANLPGIEARVELKAEDDNKVSAYSFGAQFCEVRVDPDLCDIRVSRFLGVYGGGRILNAKTARSQMIGGIIFGIGMALMEETVPDLRNGRIVNANLADYHLPVHADVPDIDVTFLEEKDDSINPIGVKGIGELGITGAAGAIANAVFHATGKRVRDLPITLDKLL